MVASHSQHFQDNVNSKFKKIFFSDIHPLMRDLNEIKKSEQILFAKIQEQILFPQTSTDTFLSVIAVASPTASNFFIRLQ